MGFEIKHIIIFLLAVVPAVGWLYLFLRKHYEKKWLVVAVFIGGMVAAKLLLIYQQYWNSTVNLIFFKVNPVDFRENINILFGSRPFLALFLSFVGVGVMEEFIKFWIMKLIGYRFFRSIDDVIELSIISALGFAFFENIMYFGAQWGKLGLWSFFAFALFRVTIVTMVHVLCSGILGYYFGMAFFASPMLKIQYMKKGNHPILRFLQFLKKVFHVHRSQVYHDQMLTIGLLTAMLVHALYDFFLSIGTSIMNVPIHIPIMLLYFFGGYWYLNHLFREKTFNLNLGLVGTEVMPKEDFVKLLGEIQQIKEKMKTAQTDQPVPVPTQINSPAQ